MVATPPPLICTIFPALLCLVLSAFLVPIWYTYFHELGHCSVARFHGASKTYTLLGVYDPESVKEPATGQTYVGAPFWFASFLEIGCCVFEFPKDQDVSSPVLAHIMLAGTLWGGIATYLLVAAVLALLFCVAGPWFDPALPGPWLFRRAGHQRLRWAAPFGLAHACRLLNMLPWFHCTTAARRVWIVNVALQYFWQLEKIFAGFFPRSLLCSLAFSPLDFSDGGKVWQWIFGVKSAIAFYPLAIASVALQGWVCWRMYGRARAAWDSDRADRLTGRQTTPPEKYDALL